MRRSVYPLIVGLTFLAFWVTSTSHANENKAVKTAPDHINFTGSKFYPPLEWEDMNGRPKGFIVELTQAMANTTNSTLSNNLQAKWEDAINSVVNGQADAVALIPSEARSQYLDFTKPFYYIAHGIFSHKSGPHFGSLEQLTGQTVAVVKSAYAEDKIKQLDLQFTILSAESELECLQLVAEGKAQACLDVVMSSSHLAEMHDLPVELTSPPLWPLPYVFGVKKGNIELLDLLNEQLANTIFGGAYKDLYKKWAHELEWKPHSIWDSINRLAWLLAALFVIVTIISLWTLALKRKVASRTAQLSNELEKSEALQLQIGYNALHDSATNLLNRDGFFEILDNEINRLGEIKNDSVCTMAIQITNLNDIIMAFGHNSALDLLKNFSDRIKSVNNCIRGHFGSGLFVIQYHKKQRANDIIDELSTPAYIDSKAIEPHLNFGIACLKAADKEDNLNAAELVRRAITALAYAQKKRLTVFEYRKEIEPDNINVQLINDFHKFGCKQFVLFYQPQLDLKTDRISYAEALIRWIHPKFGLIPPNRFIPLLEESGMINQVTRWVIQEAVAMIKRNHIKLCVNITTRDLVDDDFIEFVASNTTDIKPGQLIFEVTESDLFEDAAQAKSAMRSLAEMGIDCAVDDFGTGYSSLSYLNDLDVHEIKLDRSFVFDICTNERSHKIVSSTIELAHNLNLVVVAEGVEDLATLEYLKNLGCDRIQGYLLSKPIPELDFLTILEQHHKI